MFVHSLWSETSASFAELTDLASALLRVPASVSSQYSAELPVTGQYGQNSDEDADWSRPAADPPGEIRPVRLYASDSVIGIVSADPGLNFRLRERFAEHAESTALELHWSSDLVSNLSNRSDWRLYGIRLLHPDTQTEVVMQGGDLLAEADRLTGYSGQPTGYAGRPTGYEVVGMSVADSAGRMLTVYDEGQIWLQQVGADAVPGLVDSVVLPLFGRRYA